MKHISSLAYMAFGKLAKSSFSISAIFAVSVAFSIALMTSGCVGSGIKIKNPYVSPQQTFAIRLPLSPHPYRFIETTNNPANPSAPSCYDQVDFEDAYGLMMGVRVSQINEEKRRLSHDEIIQGIMNAIPAEVKENEQVRKLEKDIIPSKFGKMVLLTKGPYETKNGYGYEVTGIIPFQGLIYDFYATCYPYCRTPEIAKSEGINQFSYFYANLTFFGEKGMEGTMDVQSNKIESVQVGK